MSNKTRQEKQRLRVQRSNVIWVATVVLMPTIVVALVELL